MDIPKEFLSKEFLSQFKTGEDVTAFMKELHTRVYEQMLEAELDNHLGYEKHSNQGDHSGNSRNGSYKKQIQTEMGESVIQVPRDRKSEFEPVVVPKHQSRGLSIERLVISLYAKGMSVSDIESEMQEIYGINLSTSAISIITNKVSQAASEWQNRPLESLYMIVWMDGIVFKVRENGKVINKTVYLCVGLNKEGLKEVLGMWVGKNESAAFWMGVLTDLKARGVEDILITVTDNLNGFTETIKSVFPTSTTQICVVHQIRNSCRYVVWKEKKSFNQFITISGGQLCPFPIQIQKRANYSSFSPIREGFWSLFANSQSNFIQFYYSTNKIPINRYFSDKKKLVNLHKLN